MRFLTLVVALTFGTPHIAAARAQSKMAVGVEGGVLHAAGASPSLGFSVDYVPHPASPLD